MGTDKDKSVIVVLQPLEEKIPSDPYPQDPEVRVAVAVYNYGELQGEDPLGFTVKSVRQGFIRKVYCILMVQLFITTAFIAVFLLDPDLRTWIRQNRPIVFWACLASFIISMALACCGKLRRRFPWNFIFLFVYTLLEGFLLGAVSTLYHAESVLLAAGITLIICTSLTIFAFQTKYDFTGYGVHLFIATIALFLFGLAAAFLGSYFPIMHSLYATVAAVLFSMYLVHDTQRIVGGKHKHCITPEEYIYAALTLYMDIITIFLQILALTGKKRS